MTDVKRYGFYGKDDFGHHYNALSERDDEHGDWVSFEDFERLADALLEITTFRDTAGTVNSCALIAEEALREVAK